MSVIISITLENEMDTVLAYKRTIRLCEILNLTLTTRTTFTAAVSELCRESVDLNSSGILNISLEEELARFYLVARVHYTLEEGMDVEEEGLMYAKRLVSYFDKTANGSEGLLTLKLSLARTLKLNGSKIRQIKELMHNEEPINAYEEVKRKNWMLNEQAAQTEKQLQESKYINDKKNEFLSIASHELKTPLTTIKAYAQLAIRNDEECSVTVKKYLVKIDIQVAKLQSLIQQLLDVTKIESAKIDIRLEQVYLNTYIMETIEMIKHITPQHDIKVDLDFDAVASIDRLRIEQVFTNLIGNAAKYSSKNSAISISGSVMEKSIIKIAVSDEGIGMSPDTLENVFNKFYRDEKASQSYSGLGLGLFITSRIIKEHGGEIWAESIENCGSTFYFTIPCETVSLPVLSSSKV